MSLLERLPFPLVLSLRTHLGSHRALSTLTILAIATSVALATGLEMSSRSVSAELARTADELAGSAEIEVTGGRVGLPETLLERVAATRGVRVAAPFVEASVRLPDQGGSLHILGVDLLLDPQVRTYPSSARRARVSDPLRLVASADSLIVSDRFARASGLELGSTLRATLEGRPFGLEVQGILPSGGVADAFGGRVAVMDVYSLQTLLGREGWLDRVDVVVEEGADVEAVMVALSERVGGHASVRRSASRDHWFESILATLQLTVSAVVVVAILVASLLVYGATRLLMERRSRELALIQTAGLEAARVRRLLWADALLLASLGSLLGIPLGAILSQSFVIILSGISEFLQDVEIARSEMTGATVAVAFVVGVVVTLLGAIPPTRRVATRPPVETLRASRYAPAAGAGGGARSSTRLWILVPLWLAFAFLGFGLPALLQLAAIVGLGLAIVAIGATRFLPFAFRTTGPVLERILPGIGRLAGASLVARPTQTAINFAAIAGVVASVVICAVLVHSLTSTLDEWTASQYPGGVFVTAGSAFSMQIEEHIEPPTIETIRNTPGVIAVFEHYTTNILHRGEDVLLAAGNMDVMAVHGRLPTIDADPRAVAQAVATGGIAVSDGFALRFDVGPGDRVTLSTPKGPRSFPVAGVIRDYAGPGGSLNIDLAVYDELWQRPGARDLAIWTDPSTEAVIDEIEARVAGGQKLFFVYGADLERYASQLLSRHTRLLDIVAGMTAALGGIAVLNLMLGSLGDRRRELALLRSCGATRWQVGLLILADSVIAGLVGGVAGIVIGLACSHPVVTSIFPGAMGWTLDFSVDPLRLALLLSGVALASLLAGAFPAWLTRQTAPREVFAPE